MVVNVDLYSGIITKVSNALNTLVSREKPGFQALSKVLIAYPCTQPRQTRYRQHCLVVSGGWCELGIIATTPSVLYNNLAAI